MKQIRSSGRRKLQAAIERIAKPPFESTSLDMKVHLQSDLYECKVSGSFRRLRRVVLVPQPLVLGGGTSLARAICICQVNILKAHSLRMGYGSDSELQLAWNLSTLLKRLSRITLCEK